jgi:hypothetical protein
MKSTIHADILDIEELRARLDYLETEFGEILNSGDVTRLEEFTGLSDLTPEDLAGFSLIDYLSPMLEESEGEELYALREAIQDIGTCAGAVLIADEYFETFAQREALETGDLPGGDDNWLSSFIDWSNAADHMQQDYCQITIEANTYWVRS